MNNIKQVESQICDNSDVILLPSEFKHLKFQKIKNEFIVTLVDADKYEIIKGYGNSMITAINDMHSNLL